MRASCTWTALNRVTLLRDWLDFIRTVARSAKTRLLALRFNSVSECDLNFYKCGFLSGQAEELFSRGQAATC